MAKTLPNCFVLVLQMLNKTCIKPYNTALVLRVVSISIARRQAFHFLLMHCSPILSRQHVKF